MHTRPLFPILLVLLLLSDFAQAQTKVTFTGAGRMAIYNNSISGDALDGDTTTADRALSGHALFDMGLDIRPNDNTEIVAITRFRNELDGFFGAGITTDIRQLYARGLLRNAIRYQIGDINTAFTPYTMYNNAADLSVHNAAAFDIYRQIVDYENFYQDSTWRQQGIMADFTLEFNKGIKELSVRGMISKNRQSDFFNIPDRLFAAVQTGILQGPLGKVNLTYTDLFEVGSTAQFSDATSSNKVFTVQHQVSKDFDKFVLALKAETGMSWVSYENQPEAPDEMDDSFMDASLEAYFPKAKIRASLGILDVGPDFRSAAAQTRRVVTNATTDFFPRIGNDEHLRPISVADITQDDGIYNRTIDPSLTAFLPEYENVLPYGRATPNRGGFTFDLAYEGDSMQVFGAFLKGVLLREIRGQGTDEKREFLRVGIGTTTNIHKLYGGDHIFQLTVGALLQSTTRDGIEGIDEVDMTSTLIEAGIQYELIKQLDLLAGVKLLSADGNEFLTQRNEFNEPVFYSKYDVDLREMFLAGGLRYRFSETMQLTMQGTLSQVDNRLDDANSWDLSQFVIIYNMFF